MGEKRPGFKPQSIRFRLLLIILLSFLLTAAAIGPPALRSDELPAEELRVHFIDVGQGDSILVKAILSGEERRKLLIDAGQNWKGDTVIDYLEELGIETLHKVIATHPHADHIGGFTEVLPAFEVKKIIDSGAEHHTETYQEYVKTVERENIDKVYGRAGDRYELAPGVELKILSPEKPLTGDLHRDNIVARLNFKETAFMFTGDAEKETEREIAARFDELESQLLKVGHHGSHTSTGSTFLEAAAPDYGVIQVGEDNRYGHPHQEVLARLEDYQVDIFRNDIQDDIVFKSDGETVKSKTDPVPVEAEPAADRININTAEADELKKITGVGPTIAGRIIEYRQQHGPFQDKEELKNVSGIGPARLEDMKDEIKL